MIKAECFPVSFLSHVRKSLESKLHIKVTCQIFSGIKMILSKKLYRPKESYQNVTYTSNSSKPNYLGDPEFLRWMRISASTERDQGGKYMEYIDTVGERKVEEDGKQAEESLNHSVWLQRTGNQLQTHLSIPFYPSVCTSPYKQSH